MSADAPIAKDFIRVSIDIISRQYWPKIKSCVETLSSEQVRWRPPDGSLPSIGDILQRVSNSVFRTTAACNTERLGPAAADSPASATGAPDATAKLLEELDVEVNEFESALKGIAPEALVGRRIIGGRELTLMEVIMELSEELATAYGEISHLASVQSGYRPTCEG